MRWSRTLLLGGWIVALGVCAAPADAQNPDDGPTGEIELLAGETIEGDLVKLYWRDDAQEGDQAEGVVVKRADGILIHVPLRYMSEAQHYWFFRRLWYGTAKPHPIFNPPDREQQPVPVATETYLAERAYAGQLDEHARAHWENAVVIAANDGDDQTDPEQVQARYVAWLEGHGLMISEKDQRWVTEKVFYEQKGWKSWKGKWYPPDQHAELVRKAEAEGKRSLEGLVDDPEAYQRVEFPIVRAFPGRWRPDKRGKLPKVRFFAHPVADTPDEKFGGLAKLGIKDTEFVRMRVAHDDCAHVYVSRKQSQGRLLERSKAFKKGEAIEIFGEMVVAFGLVIIRADGMALR